MTLMRVRRAAQLTLPADVCRALNVQEGDFLDAEIVKDGVLLKPVAVGERQRAWARISGASAQVVDREPDESESIQATEEAIAESIREFRRAHA